MGRASSTARFQFMDRRGSPENRAIDQCVDAYSNLALLPNTPTAQLWEATVNLLEAIEVYKATPRSHKQSRVDTVELLRKQTQAVLTKLRWQKIKDVRGNKPGLKPLWSMSGPRCIRLATRASVMVRTPSTRIPAGWQTGDSREVPVPVSAKCGRKRRSRTTSFTLRTPKSGNIKSRFRKPDWRRSVLQK